MRIVVLLSILLTACDEAAAAPPRTVLVTAFHDWRELGDPPNVWRCRENPSCRLLIGDASEERPTEHDGPLVEHLRRGAPDVRWTFRTMSTTWDAFERAPGDYDVIVNLGLGVYDGSRTLQLERDAINLERGRDAAGNPREGPIDEGEERIRRAPRAVRERITELEGRTFGGYTVRTARARRDNSFLCNQTHWYALGSLEEDREAYFVHIPPAENDDFDTLARAVGGLILELAR